MHRDIKPDNLLVGDNDDEIKIADFGCAFFGDNCKSRTCTIEYAAPEILEGNEHGKTVDTFALGVLLYELLSGMRPFDCDSKQRDEKTWEEETMRNIKEGRIAYWHDIPNNAKDLIVKMLKKNPRDRISLEQIPKHSFIKNNI